MATKGANAISKHYALERIQTALNRLLDDASLDPIDIARTHRYPEALHNQQLEVIADALERLSPAPEVEDEFLPGDDLSDTREAVTQFNVDEDGVIVATDEDGDPVVSDGQDEPEDIDEDVETDDETEDEDEDEKPARKGKGKK